MLFHECIEPMYFDGKCCLGQLQFDSIYVSIEKKLENKYLEVVMGSFLFLKNQNILIFCRVRSE